jgi:hypothetical protein
MGEGEGGGEPQCPPFPLSLPTVGRGDFFETSQKGDNLMKTQNLKTKVIGPVLLVIPMACMHLGDGHHDGDHHSSISAICSIFAP